MRLDQQRMLRLICAAESYVAYAESLNRLILSMELDIQRKQITIEDAWANLKLHLHDKPPAHAVIWQERWIYDRTHLANEKNRIAMRRSRQKHRPFTAEEERRTAEQVAREVDAEEEKASRASPYPTAERASPYPTAEDYQTPAQEPPAYRDIDLETMSQEKLQQALGQSPEWTESDLDKELAALTPEQIARADALSERQKKQREDGERWTRESQELLARRKAGTAPTAEDALEGAVADPFAAPGGQFAEPGG